MKSNFRFPDSKKTSTLTESKAASRQESRGLRAHASEPAVSSYSCVTMAPSLPSLCLHFLFCIKDNLIIPTY